MRERDESGERRRAGANGPENHESLSYPTVDRVRQRLGLAADAEPDIKEFTDEELTDYADWYNNTLLSHAHERTL